MVVAATIAAFTAAAFAAPVAGAEPAPCVTVPELDTRCEAWTAAFDEPMATPSDDRATSVAVTPDGSRVIVVGASRGAVTGLDITVVAYDAAGGSMAWQRRVGGPAADFPYASALSSDGSRIFVVGSLGTEAGGLEMVVVALATNDGRVLWQSRYDDPQGGQDEALEVGLDENDRHVYVAGWSGDGLERDIVTLSLIADSGELAWVSRRQTQGLDVPVAIDVAPSGEAAYVTGWVDGGSASVVAAYSTGEKETDGSGPGEVLWSSKLPAEGPFLVFAADLSPDGDSLFATGTNVPPGGALLAPTDRFLTVAVDTELGTERWHDLYRGPEAGSHTAIAIDASASSVAVTGFSAGTTDDWDYATLALAPADGERLWEARYGFPGSDHEVPQAVAISPDGSRVYVTGFSSSGFGSDIVTLAYDAEDGTEAWVARYNPSPLGLHAAIPAAIAVARDGTRIFVAGRFLYHGDPEDPIEGQNAADYATLAYEA
jgi:outer membrane protein assembly factor BamB